MSCDMGHNSEKFHIEQNIFSKYNVVFAIMPLVAYPQYEVFKMYFCLLCVIILVCKGMQCERREMMKVLW